MPQRVRTKTVKGGPQGADAFVTIKKQTLDESRAFAARINKAAEGKTDADEQDARATYAGIILDWNWVDEDGAALPKPHNNPDVLGNLLGDEFGFIVSVVNGTNEDEKKESPPSSIPSTSTSGQATPSIPLPA